MNEVESYIREAAAKRGIDPDTAVRVVLHEGGINDPFRHGEGPAPKSQLASFGGKENSFGPMQLYISGTGAGLGDRALAAGIDPRKDWKGGVDFGLDEVVNKGWGQWYGAKAAGVTGMAGVGPNAAPVGVTPGVSLASAPVPASTAAASAATGTTPAAPAPPQTFGDKLKSALTAETGAVPDLAKGFAEKAKADAQAYQEFSQIQPSGNLQSDDSGRMQQAQALMQQLLAKRNRGLSLTGMGSGMGMG